MMDSVGQRDRGEVPLSIYLRQGFTNATATGSRIVQSVMDLLSDPKVVGRTVRLLTGVGPAAAGSGDFRSAYEEFSGKAFTPRNFREERLRLIGVAEGMVIVRTCLSESTAFEIAFNAFSGRRAPLFFAIHKSAPITTTLLKDLDDLLEVTYVTFEDPDELVDPLRSYLNDVAVRRAATDSISVKEFS